VIWPEPATACSMILEACCAAAASQRRCAVHAIKQHLSAAADTCLLGQSLDGPVPQFVQLLLLAHYDSLMDEQQPCYTWMQQETELQQYVSDVLQQLQATAIQHQVRPTQGVQPSHAGHSTVDSFITFAYIINPAPSCMGCPCCRCLQFACIKQQQHAHLSLGRPCQPGTKLEHFNAKQIERWLGDS